MDDVKLFRVVKPGEIIEQMLEYKGWNQSDLAEITGLSNKTISKLLDSSQNISAETAGLLAQAFNKSAEFWLNLSNHYQLNKKEAGRITKEELAKAKAELHSVMPVSEMKKAGWFINDVSTIEGIKNEYVRIFGTEEFPSNYYANTDIVMAARQTRKDTQYTPYYRKTWYAFAKFHAANITNKIPYNKEALKNIADNLFLYTQKIDGEKKVLEDLSNLAGVNFFVLSHLPKTYLDGAAFVLDGSPFIVYTARYNRDDNFWFVLAHEIAHVLNDFDFLLNPTLDDLEGDAKDNREIMADKCAGEYLNQSNVLRMGRQIGTYVTEGKLLRLSQQAQVSPSVALGMLQHAGLVSYKQFSKCKQKVLEKIPEKYIKG